MQKSGISDKFGKPYINGINVGIQGGGTISDSTGFAINDNGPITIQLSGTETANITLGLDAAKSRTALGLGTAALANTGTGTGQIPVLDAQGKLPESVIGDIALYDKFDIASANNINDIVTFINGITTGTTPKQGDMIFVLSGNARGTYWITVTKTPGTYTANDISGLATPAGSVDSITFLERNYTPVNGIITLPANIAWASLSGIPNASTTTSGIVKLNDNTNSTSTTEAATANAVKKVQDFANTRISGIWFETNSGITSERGGFTLFGEGPITVSAFDERTSSMSITLDFAKVSEGLNVNSVAPSGPNPKPVIPQTHGTGADPELLGKLDRSFMPLNLFPINLAPYSGKPSTFVGGLKIENTSTASLTINERLENTDNTDVRILTFNVNGISEATAGPLGRVALVNADGKLDQSLLPSGIGEGVNIISEINPGVTLSAKTIRFGGLDGVMASIAQNGPDQVDIFYGLEETVFKSFLQNTIGIKSAAYQATGTVNGTVPLIGANNKLPVSIIPDEVGGNFSSFTINNGYGVSQMVSSNPNQITFWRSPFYLGPMEVVDLVSYVELNAERGVVISQNLTDRAALHYIKCENESTAIYTTFYCGPILTFRSFSAYTTGPFLRSISKADYTGSHPGQTNRSSYTEIQIDPFFAQVRAGSTMLLIGGSTIDLYTAPIPQKWYFKPSVLTSASTLILNLYIGNISEQNHFVDNTIILDPTALTTAPMNFQILLPGLAPVDYKLFIDQGDIGTLTNTNLYNINIGVIRPGGNQAIIMVKYSQFVPI